MFLFTKKTETIQKETGIFVHPAAAFLCCLFFFLSFYLEKERAETEKSVLILYSSVLLPFPPSSFLPIPSLPKAQRIPQFLWGVFHRAQRHETGLSLCWCLEEAEARKAGGSTLSVWDKGSVSMAQSCPTRSLGGTEEMLEVVSDAFHVHPSCACGWGRTSELENSALSWSMPGVWI